MGNGSELNNALRRYVTLKETMFQIDITYVYPIYYGLDGCLCLVVSLCQILLSLMFDVLYKWIKQRTN